MKNINISLIDQVIFSSTPFVLFLFLSNNTDIETFAILSSTYTINVLFTSLYQAYLIEPVITHWDAFPSTIQQKLIRNNLIISIRETFIVQFISVIYSSIFLATIFDSTQMVLFYVLLIWISGIATSTLFLSRRLTYLTANNPKSIYLSTSYLVISIVLIYFFKDLINESSAYFYLFISIAAVISNQIIAKEQFYLIVTSFNSKLRDAIKNYRLFDLLTVPSGWILSNIYLSIGLIHLNTQVITELKTYLMISSIGLTIHPVLHNVYIVRLKNNSKNNIMQLFKSLTVFSFIYLNIFWFFKSQIYNLFFPSFQLDEKAYLLVLIYTLSGLYWLSISTIFRSQKKGSTVFKIYLFGAIAILAFFIISPANNTVEVVGHHVISSLVSLLTAIYFVLKTNIKKKS